MNETRTPKPQPKIRKEDVMSKLSTQQTPEIVADEAKAAFDRLQPERDALAPSALIRPNLKAARAVRNVLGAEHRIAALLPQIERDLPNIDVRPLRRLR